MARHNSAIVQAITQRIPSVTLFFTRLKNPSSPGHDDK